jgi:hypothetical protein
VSYVARVLDGSPRLRTGDRLLGAGRRFPLDEQRAIGEMMQRDGDEPGCISFATFANSYEERFSRWFANFAADLKHCHLLHRIDWPTFTA